MQSIAIGSMPVDNEFDEAYAKYLSSLGKLDNTNDISEKNLLFRQLAEQLDELEKKLNNQSADSERPESEVEESDLTYWI
jgi:hypothetical protein